MDGVIWIVLIGLALGLLAHTLYRGGRFGAIGDLTVGVLGAVLGSLAYRFFLGEAGSQWVSVMAATLGAALLIFDLRLLENRLHDRRIPLRILSRYAPALPFALGAQGKQEASGCICRLCGHKHLAQELAKPLPNRHPLSIPLKQPCKPCS